jgi:predicted alpha/beta superfamily hydrolase
MKKAFFILFLTCFFGNHLLFSQNITIGERHSIFSKVLDEDRPISVYLPPSYNYDTAQKFPVLYILDGDYNFRYVTGLIELQSNISEQIPEMIVVGISGKGTTTYRKNCKPYIKGVDDSGNAEDVVTFIETELMPYVNSHYKTDAYNILGGHSVGGLFVVNTALHHPKLFNQYIAISPAVWWSENAMNDVAKKIFKDTPDFSSDVYVSLADEKGMGVKEFLKFTNSSFKFKQFENENHNSVGEPTYKWALGSIFKNWRVEKLYFDSADELQTAYDKAKNTYGTTFNMPNGILYNTVMYILNKKEAELLKLKALVEKLYPQSSAYYNMLLGSNYIKNDDYVKAEAVLMEAPNSFEVCQKLAELKLAQKNSETANKWIEKAITIGKQQNARQWQLNELLETKATINKV